MALVKALTNGLCLDPTLSVAVNVCYSDSYGQESKDGAKPTADRVSDAAGGHPTVVHKARGDVNADSEMVEENRGGEQKETCTVSVSGGKRKTGTLKKNGRLEKPQVPNSPALLGFGIPGVGI